MANNSTVLKTFELISQINDELCQNLFNEFDKRVQTAQTESANNINDDSIDMKTLFLSTKKTIDNTHNTVHDELDSGLELLKNQKNELKIYQQTEAELRQCLNVKELTLKAMTDNTIKFHNKINSLDNLKNEIKFYKTLTCTDFVYDAPNTMGYISSNKDSDMKTQKPFVFPLEVKLDMIIENLWTLLEESTGEPCKQIAEDLLLK